MMTRPDGTPINAVFGFTKMLLKLTEDLKPSHVVVIFDAGRVTFRNDIYPEYKANRLEPPEELVPQFPLVREAVKAMSLPVLEMPGFEADDLIASFARAAENQNMSSLIILGASFPGINAVQITISIFFNVSDKSFSCLALKSSEASFA